MNKEGMPAIFRLKTIYYVLPFWIVIILCLASSINPHDLGHFIKSGTIMLENQAILKHDVFTHTSHGLHYINSGWLSQVLFALCERMGGVELFVLLLTVLVLLSISILYHCIYKMTRHYKIGLLFIVFAVILGFTNWNIRPQIFIIPIFTFFYSHLYRKERIKYSSLLWLSFLMMLWVNLHSSFSLGVVLVCAFLAGEAIEKYYDRRNIKALTKDSRIKGLLLLLIVLISVTLINPYGIDIWKDMWANAFISQRRSVEWEPTMMNGLLGYCFVFSAVIASIILKYSKRRITPTEAILLVGFLFAGFKAGRMIIWWGIVSAPILAVHFCSIGSIQERISRPEKDVKAKGEYLPLNLLIFTVLLISALSFLPWLRPYHPIKKVRAFIDPKTNPVGIVDYIETEQLQGKMYNDINWGSYLIWRLWPEYQVFADNRLHVVSEEIWSDTFAVYHGFANWEMVLDKYKISFVLLSKRDNKRTIGFMKDSPRWKKAYEDEVGAVFVRNPKGETAKTHGVTS